jgi:hypothetical protein
MMPDSPDGGVDFAAAADLGAADFSGVDFSSAARDLATVPPDFSGVDLRGFSVFAFGPSIDSDFPVAMGVFIDGVVLASGDFNNDKKPDLVIGTRPDNQVVVLLGKGDGTFGKGGSQTVSANPRGLVVADFNGDGNLDVACGGTVVSVMLGNGKGGLGAPDSYSGVDAYKLAAGDLNHDGAVDLVVGNAAMGIHQFGVLLGNGNGKFQTMTLGDAGAGEPLAPALGDFNGDGKLDLALACDDDQQPKYGGISILLGNGDGTFQTAHYTDLAQGPFTNGVADYNNDGKLDVMTMYSGTNLVTLMPGNGDGSFGTAKTYGFGATDYNVSFAVADFNQDGNLDVATASCCNNLDVVEGYGDFAFLSVAHPMVDIGPGVMVAIDFDGDGLVDIANANTDAGGGFVITAVRNLSH